MSDVTEPHFVPAPPNLWADFEWLHVSDDEDSRESLPGVALGMHPSRHKAPGCMLDGSDLWSVEAFVGAEWTFIGYRFGGPSDPSSSEEHR